MEAIGNIVLVIGLLGGMTYLVYRFVGWFDEKNVLHLRQLFVSHPATTASVQYWSDLGAVTWEGTFRGRPFEGRMTTIGIDIHKKFYTTISIHHGLDVGSIEVYLASGVWPNFSEPTVQEPLGAIDVRSWTEKERTSLPLPLQDPLFWSLALKGGLYLDAQQVGCYVPHQARTTAQTQSLKVVLDQLDEALQHLQQHFPTQK